MDVRSIRGEVHAFEPDPSHIFTVFRIRFSPELIYQILINIEYLFRRGYLSKSNLTVSFNYTV